MRGVLLVGSGAREVAIARKIMGGSSSVRLYCISSVTNPQIETLCHKYFEQSPNNVGGILSVVKNLSIAIAIIGPENPLEAGLVDALEEVGILCVGPRKSVAMIETSKAFARSVLDECAPEKNPERKEFTSVVGVKSFLQKLGGGYVIKNDGLMGGKGVKISGEHLHSEDEAFAYAKEIINNGGSFLIEEKLLGEEFSLMSFCDGNDCVHMPIVQDHKRAFVGDVGPNTGGMGTYSFENHSLPFLSDLDVSSAKKTNEAVALQLYKKTGEKFRGVLYGGFMLTKKGVKVIEYNARFGDPEAMNVLSLLETDFMDICDAIVSETLSKLKISFANLSTVCKYVVPKGYPTHPTMGFEVGFDSSQENLYLGAVQDVGGKIIATGSRTAATVGIDKSIRVAEKLAEAGARSIKGNLFHREDVGTDALINKRIEHMKSVCGD